VTYTYLDFKANVIANLRSTARAIPTVDGDLKISGSGALDFHSSMKGCGDKVIAFKHNIEDIINILQWSDTITRLTVFYFQQVFKANKSSLSL
jgi:hypothetical protein